MNRSLAITFLFLLTAGAPTVFAAGSRQIPVPQVPQVPQKTADAVTPYNEGVALMNAKKNLRSRPVKSGKHWRATSI